MVSDLIDKLLATVKGLTLLNAAVIGLLVMALFPAYIGFKLLNDTKLLSIVMSEYEELPTPDTLDCSLALGQTSGGPPFYFVRNVFQERSDEVWFVVARIKFKPDAQALIKYCGTLDRAIEYMRDPENAIEPAFPGSTRLLFPPGRAVRRAEQAYKEYEKSRNDAFQSQEHP